MTQIATITVTRTVVQTKFATAQWRIRHTRPSTMYQEIHRLYRQHVCFAPLICYESLSEFGVNPINAIQLRPVDELELPLRIISKLKAINIYYICDLIDLCAFEVRRRSDLTPVEMAELDMALSERQLSFHPSAKKTRSEIIKDLSEQGVKSVVQDLRDADAKGDLRATVYLGILVREYAIEAPVKYEWNQHLQYFRRAHNAGSAWAANDLAVHIFRNWSSVGHGDRLDALKLFRFAHESGLPQGTYNLAVALALVSNNKDEVSGLLALAFTRGIAQAAAVHEEWLTKGGN